MDHEDYSCRNQEKDQFLGGHSLHQKQTCKTYEQANNVLSTFVLQHHQVHTMSLSDLLNVALYTDNLKIINQACEEMYFQTIGNDLDEHVLENLYEMREKIYTHEERFDIKSTTHLLGKRIREATND